MTGRRKRPGLFGSLRTASSPVLASVLAPFLAPLLAIALAIAAIWLAAAAPAAASTATAAAAGTAAISPKPPPKQFRLPRSFKGNLPITELTEQEAALHALNRLAFGPRPGEVERIERMGLAKWIDQQLDPGSLDDSALQKRLANFATLKMPTPELLSRFEFPQMEAKREGLSLEELRQQRQQKVREEIAGLRQSGQFDPARAQMIRVDGTPQQILAELSMAKLIRAVYSPRQLQERLADFWFNHFNVYARKGPDLWYLPSYERDVIRPHAMGKFEDLLQATAKSPAMLFFLDNWASVDPQAFARNREEIVARRRQAAILRACGFIGPFASPIRILRCQEQIARRRQRQQRAQAKAKKTIERGLNENYGRELMELHTIGVHYTQADVITMAKVFTGWTIRQPRRDPEFAFDARFHTPGPKILLGYKINAGGIKDGEQMLHKLAGDPRTAHLICFELARHFVMDQPPEPLVDRMAKTFLKSRGDIRQVMRTMIYSPEFWSRQAYRAKVKTPFDLVASALRATGADVKIGLPLVQWVARMGEPLYLCEPPNGYPDTARNWVSTGALLDRMNFATALGTGHMPGTEVDLAQIFSPGAARDAHRALNEAFAAVLGGQVTPETRDTIEKRLADPQILEAKLDDPVRRVNEGLILGLVLGSPEFQRQ
ncbi:MAG TPA: DUF1800 domain-containing protein [Patescibacteria group bacterium]|nr:DUF1800 domain-containing protein [Patescibacteria group bacterium]